MLTTQRAREAAWKSFIADATEMEGAWEQACRRFFRQQRDEVIDNLAEAVEIEKAYGLNAHVKANADDILFDYDAAVGGFAEVADALMRETILRGGQAAAERFLFGIAFDVENRRVRAYVRKFAGELAKNINDTTRRQLRRTLAEGLKEGENVRDLGKRVADVYQQALDYRSERIARTEVHRASNFGALESYQQAGVEKKEWMTASGAERPRHHIYPGLNGQIRNIEEAFDVRGSALRFPGDPNGPPRETILCRCAVLPVVER